MENKIYTCKDLTEGRVACKHEGTINELQKVLEYCFPDDSQIANGSCSYYMRWSNNYAKWCGYEKGEIENIPHQSVKVFLKEIELSPNDIIVKNESETESSNPLDNLPIIGEGVLMEVSSDGTEWDKRFVFAKYGDYYYAHYMAEKVKDIDYTKQPTLWEHARPITPKTKITRAEFESKFEIID